MTTLVLTLVGADRAGLVSAVADVVAAHDGNWERSQLAELAGAFAGVVQVSVPEAKADGLRAALRELDGLLTIATHDGTVLETTADAGPAARDLVIDLIGNDRPGIVRDISSALQRHDVSIQDLQTRTRDAAMYGGLLFEAHVVARVPDTADAAAIRQELERLATEIQVDITLA
jgi:glycine cleavage system regulatory protein